MVLGRVSRAYDEPKNLLKRQVAAEKMIELLAEDVEIFNVDESILRTTDQRRRGWAFP